MESSPSGNDDVGPSPSSSAPVTPRDAATVMLVRDSLADGAGRLEVCMLRRHLDSDFVGGAYVFPGGKLDESDRGQAARDACSGRTDAEASALLGVPSGGLAFWVAVLRECFEEAGVLLAYRSDGRDLALIDTEDSQQRRRISAMRHRLNRGETDFLDECKAEGLSLAVDRVHYFSHWITPEPAPKRYDTRFFVAALPAGQTPVHDDYETVETVWVRPADALERARRGDLDVIFPTMKNLEAIDRFATSAELLAAAAAIESVPAVLPRVVTDGRGIRILLPGDPGYEDTIPGPSAGAHESPSARELSASEMGAIVRSIGIDGRRRRDDRP